MLNNYTESIKKKYGISDVQNQNSLAERDRRFKESGLSEDFRDRWNSAWQAYDPYSVQDTFWDSFSNAFGARSSADVMRMEKEQAREEALNQLINQKGEQDYNSEEEKANRLRQAGINPDLQGIGDASEAVAGNEPEQRLDFSGMTTGKDIGDSFKSVVDIGLGLMTGFQQVRGLMIDNSNKSMQRYKSVQDLAKSIVDNSLLPPGLEILEKDPDSGLDKWQLISGKNLDYDALVGKYGKDRVRYTVPSFYIPDVDFLRGRDRVAFDREINRYKRSIFADGKRYQEYYKYLSDRKNSALASSSPFNTPSYKAMEDIFAPISKLMFDINNSSLELEKRQIENQKTYEANFKSDEAAAADNAANSAHKSLEEYNKQVNDAWKTASDSIQKFGEKNPVLGMIGMVLLNWLRSNMPMPNLPGSKHTNIYDNSDKRTFNNTDAEKVVNINN